MIGSFDTLIGVILGFGLSELSQWRKSRKATRILRKALDAELTSILRMTPDKEDILVQAIERFSTGSFMPTKCAMYPRNIYEKLVETAPECLTNKERDCLHVVYERCRIIDVSMNSMEERFNSITSAHSSLHAADAISSMLRDLKSSLPVTSSMITSVLENNPTNVFGASNDI